MVQILWTLPFPSTALLNDVKLHMLSRRTCALIAEYETDNGRLTTLRLIFEGIEAFKCTFYRARSIEMIELSYDELVDVGSTKWLKEVKSQLMEDGEELAGLCHFLINFDDGPCYEFICKSFRIEER